MRNLLSTFFIFIFMVAGLSGKAQLFLENKSETFINKTAGFIEKTKTKLFYNEEYRGYFALSIKHQKLAVILHDLERYKEAMCHTKRSREALFNSWHENNRPLPESWNFNEEEKGLTSSCPFFNQLDSNLYKYSPQIELKDEPYISEPLKRIRVKH
jgi:hypothetical protein